MHYERDTLKFDKGLVLSVFPRALHSYQFRGTRRGARAGLTYLSSIKMNAGHEVSAGSMVVRILVKYIAGH
jgi:hypothetical protein